jgi:hypothetical protein
MPPGRYPAVRPSSRASAGAGDCPATAERVAANAAVIHVLAEQATLDGASDQPGLGILPAESVRELAKTAQLKPLTVPSSTPDPGYRPSAATAEFVRWRDLTCRWPGCDAPVERCDIDHTVPYPFGPTHPVEQQALLPHPPSAHTLTAGEISFAATHRYGDATAKSCHSPGTPLSS